MSEHQHPYMLAQLERLNAIGIALSAERDNQRLLEMILLGAQEITNADGGTLYTITQDKHLKFEMMRNKSLQMSLGGTTGKEIPFLPLPLYLADGSPNLTTVAAYATLQDQTVNIANVREVDSFDFSGTRKFDEKTGYHSQSFLTIPMKDHESKVIGVLQLINATDVDTGAIIPFSIGHQTLVESLASQAAVAMTNHHLIDGLKGLFEAFIELIADAIDQKSPYTGGHCRRVPELTMMLTQALIDAKTGPFKDFTLNENELYELKVASWLHDCGKVTTPEAIMDKPTKLSSIFDRIQLLDQRFELLKQQAECAMLKEQVEILKSGGFNQEAEVRLTALQAKQDAFNTYCDEARDFLRLANIGSESMTASDLQRIKDIANMEMLDASGNKVRFLNEDETYNLSIKRGTLTAEERQVINNHIVVTISMLESLPYPQSLARVPEYACGHHEHMDGSGYPKGLTREQMSIPARVMGVADIFEALTSKDRPYKKAKTLSESLAILGRMKVDNHIDPELFDIFVREGIYLKYAQQFLEPEQIDEVDLTQIPGYQP
ncbi:HD domain-containing phosphohydrolase [Methylotenera mobilis]|uniref:Putative metal dependent phosphohydrolase n=1 Tax=Methylotenera mobilis (strain JLW8 / ATCC BAA-1282 / DSM 17540) TaxID=583345 RepID=C6WU16_METML|nr:HD domain-containing phosphohydrolase [Methylotenera mobilis]ACT47415.1 putative metal dependent phosphohydrolase [Methylotenera mobilis JLW8]